MNGKPKIMRDCFAFEESLVVGRSGRVIKRPHCSCLDDLYCAKEKCAFYKRSRKDRV